MRKVRKAARDQSTIETLLADFQSNEGIDFSLCVHSHEGSVRTEGCYVASEFNFEGFCLSGYSSAYSSLTCLGVWERTNLLGSRTLLKAGS